MPIDNTLELGDVAVCERNVRAVREGGYGNLADRTTGRVQLMNMKATFLARAALPQEAPSAPPADRQGSHARLRRAIAVSAFVIALAGCSDTDAAESPDSGDAAVEPSPAAATEPTTGDAPAADPDPSSSDQSATVPAEDRTQEEICDWESPKLDEPVEAPDGKNGELAEVLVGSWQHTHTDDGSGFEEVTNDHRYVFPSPDRMLYCQHVPGATEYAENAANIGLNGTTIELPGGDYSYTVTAWDQDTIMWDNPVGGGYVYLLQRR